MAIDTFTYYMTGFAFLVVLFKLCLIGFLVYAIVKWLNRH